MGNSLCKSQNPSRSRSRNQFEEFFAGCTNFCTCPPAVTPNRNHHWKKQVIETRPPYLGSHTTSTKWHQASTLTSTQPLRQQHHLSDDPRGDKPPVAPPRKKRLLQKSRSYEDVVDIKDGFKDVFGQPVTLERQTTSSSHNHLYSLETSPQQNTRSSSSLSGNSLKIGNKKTDKFFGENLSDSLSDEPYVPSEGLKTGISSAGDKDEIDMFIEKNIQKIEKPTLSADKIDKSNAEDRLSDNLDKKAAFLMTMLDNYNDKDKKKEEEDDDDERYRGMVPVEEEIIVPKRKITKCICGETDELLHHLRHDECKTHGGTNKTMLEDDSSELKKLIEKKDKATETPPVKPKRDLSLYRKSLEISESMAKSIEEQQPPSPPTRRKKSLNASKEELTVNPLSVAPSANNGSIESDKSVKEIMDQIVQHAFPHYLDIEDIQHDSYIDGSAAVSQKISKLKERKISLNRKISTESSHSNQTSHENSPLPTAESKFVLGCREVTVSPLSFKEIPVRADSPRKSVSPETKLESVANLNRTSVSPVKEFSLTSLTKESNPTKESSPLKEASPIKEVVKATEVKKSEESVRFEEKPEKKISVCLQDDGVNMLEELIRHQHFNTTEDVINEIYKNQSNIVYEFQKYLEDELSKEENAAKLDPKLKNTSLLINNNCSPEESIESQTIDLVSNSTASETSSEASTIKNLSDNDCDFFPSQYRRDSVNDLDTWFTHNPSAFPNISDTHFDLVSSDSDNASTVRALSISDPEEEDHIPELVHNNHLIKPKIENHLFQDRRESIEDVDNWFTQHLEIPNVNLSQSLVNEDAKKADFSLYDGAKLYPFGQPRERQLSLTDEFFTMHGNAEKEKQAKHLKRSNSESSP